MMTARPHDDGSRTVVIPTSVNTWAPNLARAYRKLSFDAVFGKRRFWRVDETADMLHMHWPEEVFDWGQPMPGRLEMAHRMLLAWKQSAKLVVHVHDIEPHLRSGELAREWFGRVYAAADVIAHFSQHSLRSVLARYPHVKGANHVVHKPHLFGYKRISERDLVRRRAGYSEKDFVILVFGALRREAELDLALKAFKDLDHPQKRMIICANSVRGESLGERMRSEMKLLSAARSGVRVIRHAIGVPRLVDLFTMSDALLIHRQEQQLNSGLMLAAVELGLPIAAPSFGVFTEYLTGAGAEFYRVGEAEDCAIALRRMSEKDYASQSQKIRAVGSSWGWDQALASIFAVMPGP